MELPPSIQRALNSRRADPLGLLFPAQMAVARDALRPNARVAMHPGRRGGKTSAFVRIAAKVMGSKAGARVAFFGLTKTSAANIMWQDVVSVVAELGLDWAPNRAQLSFTAGNGSVFYVLGAKDSAHVEIARGMKWDLVGIDECGSFRPTLLAYFVDDVLEPALADHQGGLVLMGTPGAICAGYYHDACQPGSAWSVHHWTMLDNPHLPHAAEWLRKRQEAKSWADDNPTLLREYWGRWVRDDATLVYRYDHDAHGVGDMPDDYRPGAPGWGHIIGIDYGMVDSTAWVVLAFRRTSKEVWVVESFKRPDLLPYQAALVTQELYERYDPDRMVGDAGGLGKPYVEEAKRRYGLPVEAADKREKLAQIGYFNDALISGRLRVKIDSNQDYIEEMKILQWDLGRVEVTIGGLIRHEERKRIDPRFEDHLCDAGQYAYGACRAYWGEAEESEDLDPALTRDLVPIAESDIYAGESDDSRWWD